MTGKEKDFLESCNSFKDYSSIDEYQSDIIKFLTLSSWHYSEKEAEALVEKNASYIKSAYGRYEPAGDAGAEIGFSCG